MSQSKLSDFTILEQLGKGSFGVVFKVKRKIDNNVYVMKQINIGGMGRKEQEEAINEVKILASLSSPYIVRYYDSFLDQDKLNIVMELAENGNLGDRIQKLRGRKMSEQTVWTMFLQIALGLLYIHQRKVLHRDIKSLNIFLDKNDVCKIGDFGVSKVLSHTRALAHTLVGTPYYLSPELCENKPYGEKSDVWALGCVLYEMCTGKHPFDASNQGALILKIVRGKYEPISKAHYGIELSDVLHSCLSRDTADRPTLSELLARPFIIGKARQLNIALPESISRLAAPLRSVSATPSEPSVTPLRSASVLSRVAPPSVAAIASSSSSNLSSAAAPAIQPRVRRKPGQVHVIPVRQFNAKTVVEKPQAAKKQAPPVPAVFVVPQHPPRPQSAQPSSSGRVVVVLNRKTPAANNEAKEKGHKPSVQDLMRLEEEERLASARVLAKGSKAAEIAMVANLPDTVVPSSKRPAVDVLPDDDSDVVAYIVSSPRNIPSAASSLARPSSGIALGSELQETKERDADSEDEEDLFDAQAGDVTEEGDEVLYVEDAELEQSFDESEQEDQKSGTVVHASSSAPMSSPHAVASPSVSESSLERQRVKVVYIRTKPSSSLRQSIDKQESARAPVQVVCEQSEEEADVTDYLAAYTSSQLNISGEENEHLQNEDDQTPEPSWRIMSPEASSSSSSASFVPSYPSSPVAPTSPELAPRTLSALLGGSSSATPQSAESILEGEKRQRALRLNRLLDRCEKLRVQAEEVREKCKEMVGVGKYDEIYKFMKRKVDELDQRQQAREQAAAERCRLVGGQPDDEDALEADQRAGEEDGRRFEEEIQRFVFGKISFEKAEVLQLTYQLFYLEETGSSVEEEVAQLVAADSLQ